MTVPEGVVVVGMHRSGTSAATRLLNMLGLALCDKHDLMESTEGNESGHWESVRMTDLNERILADMGRAWWCPPPDVPTYDEAAARITLDPVEAATAFDAVHARRPWVWKDPRTCLALPFWRKALDRPFLVLFVYRNPVEVADSLRQRNVFTLPRSVATWERYNRLALAHCDGLTVHMSCYDDLMADPAAWCREVRDFLRSHGIAARMPPAKRIDAFIKPHFRHSRHDHETVANRFAASLPVFEALESRLGTWDSFESPALPPEPSWVEGEFVAIGAIQPEPLPQPLYPITSIITMALGRPLAPALASVAEHVPAFAEAILVTDSTSPEPQADEGTKGWVSVVRVPPGTKMGAARAAAVEAATTDLVEFRDYGAKEHGWWSIESRRAFSAGYSAITPHVLSTRQGGGYGLARKGEAGAPVWQPPPADKLGGVELLAPQCFVVSRGTVLELGNFDPELPEGDDLGTDVYDLSDRLRLAGHRLAAARDGLVDLPDEGLWPRGTFEAPETEPTN